MLLSANSNQDNLWQQKQNLLDQLYGFANLKIFDDPHDKEILKLKFIEFVYTHLFDPVYGGLLIPIDGGNDKTVHAKYSKPLLLNLYIHELFMASGQVFYDGELNYQGNLIFKYLINKITNKNINFDYGFQLEHLANFYTFKELDNHLDESEKQLFFALSSGNQQSTSGNLFCYNTPLKEAALSINIEYKQAQILDYSINKKLKTIIPLNTKSTSIKLHQNFSVKCELIISLASVGALEIETDQRRQLFDLFNELYTEINKPSAYDNLVVLITAGIHLLQLDFEHALLSKIEELVIRLSKTNNDDGKKNIKTNQQMTLIIQFISELSKRNILSNNLTQYIFEDADKTNDKFKLAFFDRAQVKTNAKLVDMKSKYNPYRLIFLI